MSKMNKNKGLLVKIIIYALLIIGSIVMILPFAWMILTAFKTQGEALKVPPQIFPKVWRMDSFIVVWNTLPFLKFFFNTLLMVIIRCAGSIFFSALAAYAFARIEFPGRNFLFLIVLATMMVPSQVYILPQYLIVSKLGLLNTITALAIPGIVSTFGTFLLRQFFMGLPKDLEDAAVLDGCNEWQTFSRIMLPLTKSGLISVGIFTALFGWKDLMWPLIVNTSQDKMTLSSGLVTLMGQFTIDYPQLMAGSIFAIAPMVVIYLIFQKQFVEGIATQGVKG